LSVIFFSFSSFRRADSAPLAAQEDGRFVGA